MPSTNLRRRLATLALAVVAAAGLRATAVAQAALPTAPGASKAVTDPNAPPSAAKASLPSYGGSPLEPWLVVWLLPVSGLLSVAVATTTDRRVRNSRA